MAASEVIHVDQEVLSGTPVFKGTRVPIQTLFWHLGKGISIAEFLDDFPTVSKDQVYAVLHLVGKSFKNPQIAKTYEALAG